MRNKRLILALTGAVICGLLAVMLVTRYLANVEKYAKELNNVVVAKTEIPVGAKITAEQLQKQGLVGVTPVLMAAANSSGGVMGKMIDAQSIVVASTATNWYGHEGSILRYVFLHSIVLACLVGILVTLQAYVYPFTAMVLK